MKPSAVMRDLANRRTPEQRKGPRKDELSTPIARRGAARRAGQGRGSARNFVWSQTMENRIPE